MKVLLCTIIDNVNYGTYLQAYATVRLLEQRGCEVTVLNYIRPHLNHKRQLAKARENGIKALLKISALILLDKYMKHNLKHFLESKAKLTEEFTDWRKFRQTLPEYDLYLVGSDQVWNSTHNYSVDEVFYFGGIRGVKKSFSSSIGIDSFKEEHQSLIKSLLADFRFLSVRESFGKDLLVNLGFSDVYQVLDPTLLLTRDEWRSICSSNWKKKEPYLLVYSVEAGRDMETLAIARKLAMKKGLKVYVVSPYLKFRSKLNVDAVFSLADTDLFLSLFSQADYAVVSSFHGTAFAINFNIPFVTVSPERFSSRVKSILQLLNLEKRYIRNASEIPCEEIDYIKINNILDIKRKEANIILDKIIEK